MKKTVEERWLGLIEVSSDVDSCWLWKGSVSSQGYGKMCIDKKTVLAHHLGWTFAGNNFPPKGFALKNQCGNKLCVNPNHWKISSLIANLGTVYKAIRVKTKDEKMEEFANKINENGSLILDTPCWEWLGTKNNVGYGYFSSSYFSNMAHRASWEIFIGLIPDGLFVCHHCDNRSCVNPEHLFLGTAKDNAQDMVQKGRHYNPKTRCSHN